MSDSKFLDCDWPPTTQETEDAIKTAKEIMRDVQRRAFVRAIAFGPELIAGFDTVDKTQQRELRQNWRLLSDIVSRDAWSVASGPAANFRTRIAERARRYLTQVGQPTLADGLKDHYVVIDLPDVQGIARRTRSFVGDETSGVRRFNELFRVEKWAEAYENQKITGYVFCPSEVAIAVHLAFRDIVREEFNLGFEDWSWALTKISLVQREEFAAHLIEKHIHTAPAAVPEQYRKRQLYLVSRHAKMNVLSRYCDVVEELGNRFKTYQSPSGEDISKHRIENWLLQFDPDDIPLALTVLQRVRYWDRAAITDAFTIALSDWDEEVAEAQWVPLGGPTTSSLHLNYLWPDLKGHPRCPAKILSSGMAIEKGSTIVFYDDNVGSGGQATTVLQQWCGLPREDWIVTEEHVKPLPPDTLEIVKQSRIRFLFATGRRRGLQTLISNAKKLLSNGDIDGYVALPEEVSCFRPAAGIFDDNTATEQAREAFRRAGRRALSDRQEDWGEIKTNERLLGYGNHAGLNVFYYNVPTGTITALWKSSDVPGSAWMALFPRRTRA